MKIDRAGYLFIAAALLPNKNKGLKSLAFYERLVPQLPTEIEELIGRGKNQITFAEVPIERALPYAAADADLTLRLKETLARQLAEQPKVEELFERLTERRAGREKGVEPAGGAGESFDFLGPSKRLGI